MNLAALEFEPAGFGWLSAAAVLIGAAAVAVTYGVGVRYPRLRFGLSSRWRFGLHTQTTGGARPLLLACRLGAIACVVLALLHPKWVTDFTRTEKPTVAVVLDDSESMAEPVAGSDAGGPTRYGKAVQLLRERLEPSLSGDHLLEAFDVQGRPLDLKHLPPRPAAASSPLTATLLRVQQEVGADRPERLAGIVLLSDGAQTADDSGPAGLEQLHVPVHSVQVAGDAARWTGPPDLSIQAVSAGSQALAGNTVQVLIDLAAAGDVPATRVPVSILDGNQTLASRTVAWRPGLTATRAELEFIPRKPGRFTYAVQVGALPGEVNLANNRQTFSLAVRAKPLTVLYADGVVRWEGKFIREALSSDPDISVISAVRTARAGSDRGSQGLLLADQLANLNLVILGDVEASYFTREELRALKTWVTEKRGALVLTGGYHSFGPEGFGRSELRDVLPVEFSAAANPQIEQPFSLKLTDAGRESPIFHLTGDRLRDAAFYAALPPLAGCSRIAGLKPGAEVLAVNPSVAAPDGRQGLPVMVAQQAGNGRSLVFAVDTTWKWRMVVGGFTGDTSFYQRFWGQLVRWMVDLEDQPAATLLVSTDRPQYQIGQTIELNIALQTRPGPASAPAEAGGGRRWRVAAQALDEKGTRTPIPLAELSGHRYRGTLGASRAGRVDLMVSADPAGPPTASRPDAQDKGCSQVVTVLVERPDIELLDPRPNPQWLAQVAQATGGRCVQPEQVDELAKQLPARPVETRIVATQALWYHPALTGVLLVLLCTEWLLRRRSRLP